MKSYYPLSFIQPTLSLLLAILAIMQHLRVANADVDAVGNETDYKALLAIKSKLIDGSPNNGVLSSWNHSLHHCFWVGVTCGHKHNNRVIMLDIQARGLSGTMSPFIGNLSFLRMIALNDNDMLGSVPPEIGRLFRLRILNLYNNNFTGNLPIHLGRLRNLKFLNLASNNFVGDINFISTLVNCTKLKVLDLQQNSFTGTLPKVVANLSHDLTWLGIGNNFISGEIPVGIGNLIKLKALMMEKNKLTSSIPHDFGNLQKLECLDLYSNRLVGEIPNSFTNLSHVRKLTLHKNNLYGKIHPSLSNCTHLLYLDLTSNKFNGSLPKELFEKQKFIQLSFAKNFLEGPLPMEISNQKNLEIFSVSNNHLSGELPNVFNSLPVLQELYMDHNLFQGIIPPSFNYLKNLLNVDLSHNNLSGPIPEFLSSFPLINNLNLSYNNFKGSVPIKGVFANESAISLFGNSGLCGGIHELHLPRCDEEKDRKRRRMPRFLKSKIIPIVCAVVGVLAMAICIWLWYLMKGYNKRKRKSKHGNGLEKESFMKVSYEMLLKATDGFSQRNLLGSGTFGSVFKGILDEEIVVVKVLNLEQRGGLKSFMAECEALRNIRHRNLVGIITACSTIDFQRNDFKALVYEFMPNGSLDGWLHGDGNLSLLQRVDIAIDVANALNYLHHECGNSIVHCDLKPSNILLDYEMVAHVSDFGLAKILGQPIHPNQSSSIGVRGTVGYVAPEYGMGGEVSIAADLYSYGILLLELMTAKRPTDDMFKEDFNLHMYAKAALPDQVLQIVDVGITKHRLEKVDSNRGLTAQEIIQNQEKCMMVMIKIGVACSNQLPHDRMNIGEAVRELREARKSLLNRRRRHSIPRGA